MERLTYLWSSSPRKRRGNRERAGRKKTADIDDVLDDSITDADFEPTKETEIADDDDDDTGDDETDLNKSPLVKKVAKGVKVAIWNYCSKHIERNNKEV